MSQVQACATCHFWEEQSKHCRRYAPSPTLGSSDDEPQNVSWVLTDAEDWCGDYEPIFEEEEVEELEEDEEWDADGTPTWSPPPPTPPARRGLFG